MHNAISDDDRWSEILSRVVKQSPACIVITNRTGAIEYVNPRFEELTGYTKEEALGQNPRILKSENNPPEIYKQMWESILDGGEWRGEICNRKKNGELFWEFAVISGLRLDGNDDITHFIAVKNNITTRKHTEEKLANLNEQNELILKSVREGILGLDLDGKHTFVNPIAASMLGYEPEELIGLTSHDIWHHTKGDGSPYPKEECQVYAVFQDSKTRHVSNEVFWRKDGTNFHVEYTSTPIYKQGELVGVVVFFTDITNRRKTESDLEQAFLKLRKSLKGTIDVILKMLSMKDTYTSSHSESVSSLATKIAQGMDLPYEQVEEIQMAALIHDIGKIYVPEKTLSNPGKLKSFEIEEVRYHVQAGFEALENSELSETVKQAVHQHHERLNGSGYPKRLQGNQISLEARILAVADVVDAMISHRPYRASLGIDAALVELVENRGILYDPIVVDACFKILVGEKKS